MASHRYSMTQHNTITPESRKISSVPTSSTAESRGAVKKRFFFSTSNIRFWITKPSEKKTSLLKLSNSAADIINHGDQLRYIKEERNTMRRRLHECSLRNSDRNLHLMRTSCISEQQQQQQQQQDITGTNIQLRHMSEPNVNMVNNRNTQERYLQFLSRTNGSLMYQKNNDDDDDHIDDDKIEQNIGSEWEEWMKNQPISVLRLDRTERLVLKIGDERDAIQKKTFTKWINKHLGKTGLHVEDLFVDLTDGYNLIALLEALSAEKLPRENGYTRFHRIQNVQYCLDFLKKKNIKTVNIRPEDIVEGSPKLTLGLIWTIILNFQVSVIKQRQREASGSQVSEVLSSTDGVSARDALLQWAQDVTRGYPGVNVRNFTNSWRDGLAFNAILHRYRPNLIQWSKIIGENVSARDRLNNAFAAAESEFGVSRLLDAEDVDVDTPDEKSIITYVSSLYNALPHTSELSKYENVMYEYEREASEWLHWVERAIRLMDDRQLPTNLGELRRLEHDLERFKSEDLPPKAREKQRLADHYAELHQLFERTEHLHIPIELSTQSLDRSWQRLLRSLNERFNLIEEQAGVQGSTTDIISRLARGIGITNEKLDHILNRIEDAESRIDTSRPADLQRLIDGIIDDLVALEAPIGGFFEDVDQLKRLRHPEANDYYQQVYGLEQRRQAYLSRLRTQFVTRLGIRTEQLMRENEQRRETIRRTTFVRVEDCIQWVRSRLGKLSEMEFIEDLEQLESMFEEHKIDNHEIQDFRRSVDECIARQAEISAEDTHEYCELLSILESEYQQLRDLSAGRMLDLDTLIAFIRGAQHEIVWINEREDIEVSRNWSDIKQLDLPMLQNYYKQLLHEIELREPRFNDVHNKGAALLNQGHPAIHVIEFYLNAMQRKWDWLLALSKCLEQHLRDALNLNSFMEDASAAEDWMIKQSDMLGRKYNRSEFSLEEGEQMLRELDEISELIKKYHSILMTLTERSSQISPLWQRGERIQRPIPVVALADYTDKDITIREGDECILVDNSDLIHWKIREPGGAEVLIPSVVFRILPPDSRITTYLNRLHTSLEKLHRLWAQKHRMVRYNMVLNTMAQIRNWNLNTFAAMTPEERDAIMKALNDDAHKLLSELEPNDPLAMRLKEELRLTNEHFYDLLNQMNRPKEPEVGAQFDAKIAELLVKLDEAYRNLNDRVMQNIPKSREELERLTIGHKDFEDGLQALDVDVSAVNELFRQIPEPSPSQRANFDHLSGRWEDLWELSRMYVERLKSLEAVLNGLIEVTDIVRRHEIMLNSFDDMPASLDKLRGVHSQLLELNMVLQQQQTIIDALNHNIAILRQHVSRTRQSPNHPDVDRLEDEVQTLTVRWENVCSQVVDRLKTAEHALQTQIVYRTEYENEIKWLDNVEATINSLRKPEELRPEQYQQQLDQLIAEYSQLQERTEAVENVNREGGKFIREAKGYDNRLMQYMENIINIHGPVIRNSFRRSTPQPKSGTQQVTEELEHLNRRFAQLSSLILERRNIMQILIQNWKRKKQEDLHNECTERQIKISEILDTFDTMSTAISEDFWLVTSSDDASLALDRMQKMRNELLTYASKVQESIEGTDRLCTEGAEFFTPDQFHNLKEHRNKLETNYNQLLQHTDTILPKLNVLTKLLLEFSNESSLLHSFLNEKTRELNNIKAESGDLQVLQWSHQKAKMVSDEVIAANERLKSIGTLSKRIQSEIDDYVIEMRLHYPNAQFPSIDAHELTNTIYRLQADYDILVRNCHDLSAYLSQLKSLATAYKQNAESLNESVINLEQEISETESILRTTDTMDSGSVMSQLLSKLENLQHVSFEQTSKIEMVTRSATDLSNALAGTDAHERISHENQCYIDELARKQIRAQKRIEENIDLWRSKLAKTEGLREGMTNIMKWLDEENKRYSKPISLPLCVDKLIELRHQNELRQREILSRQKVLTELQADTQKIAAANPDSIASRQMLSDCNNAQEKFSTLLAISKANADNIAELSTALTNFNDMETSINEKLLLLDEKLSNTSLTDISALSEISDELKHLAQNKWKEMEDKCRWIFAVPGIVEDNYLEKKVSYTDNAIKKFISRLEEFINYGRDIEKLCKTSNELKCKLTANLKDLETKAQTLEVCSLNPVDLANQRSMCQQLQTEYQNCRSEFETLNDVVSKLVEVETITRMKMKGSAGQSEQAQVLQREISSMQQRYTSLGSFLRSKSEKISTDSERLSEWDLQRDSLARWIRNETKRLKTDYPITLVNEVIQTNIVKAKRLEEILAKEKQLEMEEIRSKARLLMCEPAIPGTSDIVNSQRELEIDWKKLNQEASTLKEWHENAEMLLEEVISLNKWLIQKDRMMSAIGTVNIDPKVIDNQLIQTELLRSELEDQSGARNKVNELAHNLVAGSATPTNVQQIVKEIDILNRRWVSFHDELETKKVTLQKIKELGSNFSSKQRDVKMQLIGIAEAIEQISRSPLISKNDIDEQLKILDTLSTRSSEIDSNLEEMKKLVNLICDITQDHSLQTDIREQLTATIQSAQELNKKIESMKIAATNTKNEEGQIITEAEGAIKWIEDMQEQLSDLGPLSVISVELNEQRATIEKIYSAVLDREGDITLLRAKLIDQVKKVANSKQKATLDNLSAVWNPLLEEIKTKHANAERAFDLVNQLETLLKSLTMHVDENRLKLNEISGSKDIDMANLTAMKQEVGKQEFEVSTLETLLDKLEVITTGPSLRKLGREVENAAGDLRVLLKDIKNVWQKTQTSMDIQKQFSKVTEEAQILLDAAKETAESLKGNDGISSITKEVLMKTVDDFENCWLKKERELQAALKDVEGVVTREEAENFHENVRKMGVEYAEVIAIIQDLHCEMKKRDEMLDVVKQKISLLSAEIRNVNGDLSSPIERNVTELEEQNKICDELLKNTAEKEKILDELASEWQQIYSGTALTQTTQKNAFMQQINEIKEDLNKQRAAITQRKRIIGNTLLAVQEFVCRAEALRDEFEKLTTDVMLKEPIQTELNVLRTQQKKLRIFHEKLQPINQSYATVLESCDKLIKSADEGVSTAALEEEKNKLINVWNALNKQIADREQQVCVSLQELGSYTDAHNALLVWLQDTEESLQNQRPPSIEYKVVKEQTRANDILLKHIEEKQQSIDGFKTLIDKVVELITDVTKSEILKKQADSITQRYAALVESVQDRRSCLHNAIVLTNDWAQLSGPFKTWLEATERTLQELGQVPTDEEKFKQQINLHQKLQESIEMKNTDVEKMMQLCHLLANLASDEEAAELETICKNYMIRYKNLSTQAAECGILLQQIGEEITNFLKRTNMLTEWLEKMENDMDKLDTISIYPEELSEQSTLLADLTMEITKQEALVSAVVEDGHELCRQTTGDEAIALQSRIEALRARYLDLTAITDAKIAILSEALPLSEKFHDGYDIVQQWMDAIEQDLQTIDQTPLETQATILAQMEDDLAKWRSDVEEISDVSKQLQNLVHFKADELEIQTDDMNRRFNHLAEQITCKGDKLTSVEKQSRQVLDELDYLNEWFADAHDRLLQSSAPEVDPDYVKKQLKNQKQMNEDIAVMKARLRDAAANAHKIVRALGGEINGQDLLLGSKIETGRALSADVAQLGDERLAKLEQALALCLEIDQSFGELHSWLESMENEIENCPPVITGHQRDQLMQQQLHNTSLQHSVISHRPLMDRFHKNVGALSELCGPEDEVQLQKIAEGLDERFFAARDAVNQRAKALETAIEQSSQFTDRLDVVLANLDGAAMQIRNLEAIPADLERIKSQIVDNRSLMEQLKHKESVLRSVKKNAQEILMQAKPNDTGAAEISIKIKELDAFWDELMKGITIRESNLKDALVKAEGFWYELKSCQETIKELRMRIEGIQPELGEPATIEQQRNIFLAIKSEIEETKPKFMDKLRSAGRDLSDMVAEEEKTHVEQQINEVEGGWIAITSMCARKESDFLEVMEKAMKFHHLLAELIKWIGEVEIEVSKLDSGVGASSTDIRNELAALGDLRSLLDEKALEKEQLNQLCASLCVDSTAHQSTSIRTPISDLNIRWNKLYALLNERQQKMEKALLEMGQFSQAYEQLMIWIEKTQHVLNEINSRPTSIKEAEIEVCKHRVIQNEILVHEASIDTLNSAAKRIIAADPNAANSTQPMIDKLNSNWHILVDKLEDVWVQLDDARKAAENLGSEVDRWTMWLQDKDADLSHAKPTGGLPETAQAQLDDFFVLKAEIEQNRSALEAHLEIATKYLSDSDQDSWIAQRGMQLTKKWIQVQDKIAEREQKLRIALTEAEQLRSSMTAMNEWLNSAENYLGCLEHVARIPETIEKQMNKHIKFQAEVSHYRELMSDLNSKGTKVQYYCEKKDAIPIKNFLVSAKHRFDKVASRCTDRMKQLDLAIQEARLYFEAHVQLVNWISSSLKWVTNEYAETTSGDRLRIDLEKHKKFQHELMEQQVIYEATYKRGKTLSEHAPREEQKEIDLMNEMLKERWTQLVNAALQKQRSIEDALLACGQFDEALFSLREWLEKSLPNLQNMETISVYGDLETVEKLRDEHNELKEQIDAHRDTLNSMKERAQQILEKETDNSLDGLREKVRKVNADWLLLEELAKKRDEQLKVSYDVAKNFNDEIHEFLDFLPRIEARLRTKSQTTEGESEILEQMDEIAQLHKEMDDKEPLMQSIKKTGEDIQSKCHPSAVQPMKYWLKVLQNRWDEVTNAIDSKRDDLEMQLNGLRAREKMTADLLKYIEEKSTELKALNKTPLPQELNVLNRLIDDHEKFEETLREKQALVDEATKSRRKFDVEEKVKKKSGKAFQTYENRVRHPKSDQLSSKWKKLWIESMDYGRQLREMKDYSEEVKRLESFSFEEWRERYLEWTDSGKARISDLFRRIDKSGTGRVPRSAFIDGIITSKFPTTRLEMEKVADEFDKGDGMIDSKEFMAKLRSEFSKKLPMKQKTDSEKITEEVVRQTERCNCINRYKIQKVGDGHYRFGETQIKRMVRILRSTVMVRVGGGWVALEEFLHKHDPCRAKGRTNLDLQRNFYDDVRPKDAYDTMETFVKSARSTPSRDSPIRSFQESLLQSRFQATPGPITKIREKTERSMPMYVTGRSSTVCRNLPFDVSKSNRKLSEMNGQDSKIRRPSASSSVSRSGSRGDMLDLSRPVSRSSDVSLDGDRPTRIPSLRGRKGVNYRSSPARASPQPRV